MGTRWRDEFLLITKLNIPQSYACMVVPRVRLYDKLDAGIKLPLTLLAAPAGFGKTTLLSDWVHQLDEMMVAWISLGQSDNDLERFWSYVVVALDRVIPGLQEQLQPLLQSFSSYSIEDILIALINRLVGLTTDVVLILDDYHTIVSQPVHQSIAFLLDHLPVHFHIILSTRVEPPLPLARLRVRNRILELRIEELRFTLEEATTFLVQGMKLLLETRDIVSLMRGTEGWIAGLQLAALSLQGRHDNGAVAQFIETFAGTNKYILNYLTEEVLSHFPYEVQDFLLSTSVLRKMNASLCDALTEQGNAETMLAWLDHANLFIPIADDQGLWYRYHQLFADLLRYRLRLLHPERVAMMHLRASQWYEQQKLFTEAIDHALCAGAMEYAASLVEQCAWVMVQQGDLALVYSWLEQLHGRIQLEDYPKVAFLSAMVFLHQGDIAYYQYALDIAEESWEREQNDEMLCNVYDLRAHRALFVGDGAQAIHFAQKSLALSQGQLTLSGASHVFRGAGYLYCGDLPQAATALALGQHIGAQDNRIIAMVSAAQYLGDLNAYRGQLHDALTIYQQGIHGLAERLLWLRVTSYFRIGEIYREWNDIPQVEEILRQAMSLSNGFAQGRVVTEGDILAARVAWMRGKLDLALVLLDRAEANALRADKQRVQLARITALRVQYLLAHEQWELAQSYFVRFYPGDESEMFLLERELWLMARVRLLIAQEEAAQALYILHGLLPEVQQQGRTSTEIEILILLCQAYYALGDARHTRQTLEHVLTIAEPGGYQRIFLDEGQIMVTLLTELYHRQPRRNTSELQPHLFSYLRTLLCALGQDVEPRGMSRWYKKGPKDALVIDHLSGREQEVLRLIAEGNSNQQIARRLVVAESTIKTHLNNIYSKLNVNSRLQALTKAHSAGLLE